ncbi:MAG: ATP-dependent zinc metalloprotease FtsH [Tissierellia bacterium]|nr:ATP-dependent zinc metalloprotease FtsH [Tissierellia bacterium]
MNKKFGGIGIYVLLLILIYLGVRLANPGTDKVGEIDNTELIELIQQDKVKNIQFNGANVYAETKDGAKYKSFLADELRYTFYDSYLKEKVESNLITMSATPVATNSWIGDIFSTIVMVLLFGGLMFFLMQQLQGGAKQNMNFGKSRAKMHKESDQRLVTFKEVAGLEEEKEELAEIVDFLKSPRKYTELGARIPTGILMVGPPGTGKTYLSKAVAGEAGVPFFTISGSDFVEMFVGVGASRVRDLFENAKKNAPCIVFIDEIDAVGRRRGAGLGGGHDEREQTLNQLLVEMDGFSENEGVIIMAATNRADILDPALLRPGRFDRTIYVGKPDVRGREAILKVHTRNKPLEEDVNLQTVARRTPGFTPADLENLVNEAALLAARFNRKKINNEDIEEASIKVQAGPAKKSRVVSEKERRLTAVHEAGHAVVSSKLENAMPVHMITIIPRGGAGGFTAYIPEDDMSYMTKRQMQDELVSLLGGRVAESLVLEDISTGASNDIQRATAMARAMVTHYGMSDRLGPINFGTDDDHVFVGRDIGKARSYSEEVAAEIDAEVKSLIDNAYDTAKKLLKENMNVLLKVSDELLIRETLDAKEFNALIAGEELPPFEHDESQDDKIEQYISDEAKEALNENKE